MAEEENSSYSYWMSTIPEIFYDVLARILPGAVALSMAANGYGCFRSWILHVHAKTLYTKMETSSVVLVLGTLLACWVVGLLLTPLGDALWRGGEGNRIFAKIVREHGQLMQKAEARHIFVHHHGSNLWKTHQDGALCQAAKESAGLIYQQLHEYLKDRRVEWRGVLTKNQAEVTFYANTAAAARLFVILSVFIIPAACGATRVPFLHLISREGLGFLLTAVSPALLVWWLALRGMWTKHERLWLRHLAYLTVDFMATDRELTKPLV